MLAPTLAGHAGGEWLPAEVTSQSLADGVERLLDELGLDTVDAAGNSLGGYVALQLAERGRARSVVALAPAGGWPEDDPAFRETLEFFRTSHGLVQKAAPNAERIASTPGGRRGATRYIVEEHEHLPEKLIAHQIRGAAACDALPLVDRALRDGYPLALECITCPVRIVWGTADRILRWPDAAARYREQLHADWVVLDGVGHSPQLERPLETAELIRGWVG